MGVSASTYGFGGYNTNLQSITVIYLMVMKGSETAGTDSVLMTLLKKKKKEKVSEVEEELLWGEEGKPVGFRNR